MDPSSLANPEWSDISSLLTNLWLGLASVVLLSVNLVIGHIVIPSLVYSFHLPLIMQKARSIFYLLAVAFLGAAVVFAFKAISALDVIGRFWNDYWI